MEPAHKEEKEADAKAKLGEAEQAQDNDGPQHEEGEEAEEVQEVEEGQQPTEEQQREQLKADIQAHNVNVTFTKIYLDDKALLRGFRVRPWVVQQLHQIVDRVVELCEPGHPQQGGDEDGEDEEEDEMDVAVREEAAEMARTMQQMGWDVPLAFGGGVGGGGKGKGKGKKRPRPNQHIHFDEEGNQNGGGSPPPSKMKQGAPPSFFSADGKDEAPHAPVAPAGGQRLVQHASSNPPQKYWMQRFRLFSQFDLGCRLDEEGWFSVTPERIARHIAERSASDVVVDLFVGCGGNAIQFALASHYVVAIDLDPVKLSHARHNAQIYGVADRIEFILGDALTILPSLGKVADVIFMSPPWGGPEYMNQPTYSLDDIRLVGNVQGKELLARVLAVCPNVAVLLPRNVDLRELAAAAGGRPCEVEENVLNYKLKTITVYYGGYFLPSPPSDWTLKKQRQQQQQQGGGKGKKRKKNKRQRAKNRELREGGGGGNGDVS